MDGRSCVNGNGSVTDGPDADGHDVDGELMSGVPRDVIASDRPGHFRPGIVTVRNLAGVLRKVRALAGRPREQLRHQDNDNQPGKHHGKHAIESAHD
ncbi:MAG: hypothetical protein AB7O52_17950 [Planctomycetota bacterium]